MIEAEPPGPASASVILMHGLGADAGDLYPLPPAFGLPAEMHVRYVFPSAPRMPVTINMGMLMPAWYDIRSIGPAGQDEPGIRRAAAWIDELIAREVARGVPASRIVLAGFSQGGAMALFTALRYPQALAGVICMSGYLLLADTLAQEAAAANRSVPIFVAHGTVDPMVDIGLGRRSRDLLVEAGYAVDWHEYPMAHQICGEELTDIGRWLTGLLAPAAGGGGGHSPLRLRQVDVGGSQPWTRKEIYGDDDR